MKRKEQVEAPLIVNFVVDEMTADKPRRGRKPGAKNKSKIITPKPKKPKKDKIPKKEFVKYAPEDKPRRGRKLGSKNKSTIENGFEVTTFSTLNDITPNLFVINEHELFNIISTADTELKSKELPKGTVFGLMIEETKEGKVYFCLTQIKKGK